MPCSVSLAIRSAWTCPYPRTPTRTRRAGSAARGGVHAPHDFLRGLENAFTKVHDGFIRGPVGPPPRHSEQQLKRMDRRGKLTQHSTANHRRCCCSRGRLTGHGFTGDERQPVGRSSAGRAGSVQRRRSSTTQPARSPAVWCSARRAPSPWLFPTSKTRPSTACCAG